MDWLSPIRSPPSSLHRRKRQDIDAVSSNNTSPFPPNRVPGRHCSSGGSSAGLATAFGSRRPRTFGRAGCGRAPFPKPSRRRRYPNGSSLNTTLRSGAPTSGGRCGWSPTGRAGASCLGGSGGRLTQRDNLLDQVRLQHSFRFARPRGEPVNRAAVGVEHIPGRVDVE